MRQKAPTMNNKTTYIMQNINQKTTIYNLNHMFSQKINTIMIKLTRPHDCQRGRKGKEGKQPAKITQDVLSTRDC